MTHSKDLSIRTLVRKDLHKKFKVRCYEQDDTMYNVLNGLISKYLEDTDPKQ